MVTTSDVEDLRELPGTSKTRIVSWSHVGISARIGPLGSSTGEDPDGPDKGEQALKPLCAGFAFGAWRKDGGRPFGSWQPTGVGAKKMYKSELLRAAGTRPGPPLSRI